MVVVGLLVVPKEYKLVSHPAKYTPIIIDKISEVLKEQGRGETILDPFGGVGGIHTLQDYGWHTTAIEIEQEWADQSKRLGHTICANFLNSNCLDSMIRFDNVVTSPCYGNRMADHHVARDNSKRMTYRHRLGRELSAGSSASLQWGKAYRSFHAIAWRKVSTLVRSEGLFILNVKDHIRKGEVIPVSQWHRQTILQLGFRPLNTYRIYVKGMGYGQHQQTAKVNYETIYVFRKEPL